MSYSDFTLRKIKKDLKIQLIETQSLFPNLVEHQMSRHLAETIEIGVPLAHAVNTEKARSEMIIAPILIELKRITEGRVSLFSGVDFTVDPELGLKGVCDFLISKSPEQLYVSCPVLAIVEAKNENIKGGIPQCLAEMVAARKFNEQEEDPIPVVYGCVTTGTVWKFLQLEDTTAHVDHDDYYIDSVGKILAVLLHMVS